MLVETKRVCRLGELSDDFLEGVPSLGRVVVDDCLGWIGAIAGSLSDGLREVISPLRGDVARACPLVCCGDRPAPAEASFKGAEARSEELFARKKFGLLCSIGGLVLSEDLLRSSSSSPS